jgi:hypothetical protein
VGCWPRFLLRQHPAVARPHHAGDGARYAAEADECLHGDKEEIRWRLGMTAEIIKHGGRA